MFHNFCGDRRCGVSDYPRIYGLRVSTSRVVMTVDGVVMRSRATSNCRTGWTECGTWGVPGDRLSSAATAYKWGVLLAILVVSGL